MCVQFLSCTINLLPSVRTWHVKEWLSQCNFYLFFPICGHFAGPVLVVLSFQLDLCDNAVHNVVVKHSVC